MKDLYVTTKDEKGREFAHWEGELDEDKQYNDSDQLFTALFKFAMPFLVTCDDPIGVLDLALDALFDSSCSYLEDAEFVKSFQGTETPQQLHDLLMARKF